MMSIISKHSEHTGCHRLNLSFSGKMVLKHKGNLNLWDISWILSHSFNKNVEKVLANLAALAYNTLWVLKQSRFQTVSHYSGCTRLCHSPSTTLNSSSAVHSASPGLLVASWGSSNSSGEAAAMFLLYYNSVPHSHLTVFLREEHQSRLTFSHLYSQQ